VPGGCSRAAGAFLCTGRWSSGGECMHRRVALGAQSAHLGDEAGRAERAEAAENCADPTDPNGGAGGFSSRRCEGAPSGRGDGAADASAPPGHRRADVCVDPARGGADPSPRSLLRVRQQLHRRDRRRQDRRRRLLLVVPRPGARPCVYHAASIAGEWLSSTTSLPTSRTFGPCSHLRRTRASDGG